MNKRIIYTLSLFMVFILLVGCGGSKKGMKVKSSNKMYNNRR